MNAIANSLDDRMPGTRSNLQVDPYVVDVLMRDLIGHDRQPSAFLVYLFLSTRTEAKIGARRRGGMVAISLRDIAEATGLSKSVVQVALRTLKRRELIGADSAHATAVPTYRVLRPWRR